MTAYIQTPAEDSLTLYAAHEIGADDLTINGILFEVPPNGIQIADESQNYKVPVLRTEEAIKIRSGKGRIRISISAIASGIGESEFVDKMNDSIMPMAYSLRRFPLCFVENRIIRAMLPVDATEPIACMVQNMTCQTLSGFPHALAINIQLIWFNHRAYTPRIQFRTEWNNAGTVAVRSLYNKIVSVATAGGHGGRTAFVERFGSPSKAFNATALFSTGDHFIDARPLHEHLWPHLMKSTNSANDNPASQKVIDIGITPFAFGGTSHATKMTFRLYESPREIELEGRTVNVGKLLLAIEANAQVAVGSTTSPGQSSVLSGTTAQPNTIRTATPSRRLSAGTGTSPPTNLNGEAIRVANRFIRAARYPKQWDSLIQKAAAATGVNPNLIAAFMMAESKGEHNRASTWRGVLRAQKDNNEAPWISATGLMQITPVAIPTSPRYGFALPVGESKKPGYAANFKSGMDDRLDPEKNVLMGAIILAGLMRNKKLRVLSVESLAWAYNRGAGRMDRQLAAMEAKKNLPIELGSLKHILSPEDTKDGLEFRLHKYILEVVGVYEKFTQATPGGRLPLYSGGYGRTAVTATPVKPIATTIKHIPPPIPNSTGTGGSVTRTASGTKTQQLLSNKRIIEEIDRLAAEGWEIERNEITKKIAMARDITLDISHDRFASSQQNDGVVITAVSYSFGNSVVQIPISGQRLPTLQHMGGQMSGATLSMYLVGPTGEQFLQAFKTLHNSSESAAIHFREFTRGRSALSINNQLLNAFGLNECIIENIEVSTVDGLPETKELSITLVNGRINQPIELGKNRNINLSGQISETEIAVAVYLELMKNKELENKHQGVNSIAPEWKATFGFYAVEEAARAINITRPYSQLNPIYEAIHEKGTSAGLSSITIKLIYETEVTFNTYRSRGYFGVSPDAVGINAVERLAGNLKLRPDQWASLVGGDVKRGGMSLLGNALQENIMDGMGLLASPAATTAFVNACKLMIYNLEKRGAPGVQSQNTVNLIKKIADALRQARPYNPLGEALPDLHLPPSPITGQSLDFSPDGFFYNESDISAAKSELQSLILGQTASNITKGILRGMAVIKNRISNINDLFVESNDSESLRPANVGIDGIRAKAVAQLGAAQKNKKTNTVKYGDLGPKIENALLNGSPLAAANALGTTTRPTGVAAMVDKNSPHFEAIERGRQAVIKGQHTFSGSEYERIFDQTASNYEGDHYTLRRAFPAYRVYIVEEEAIEANNTNWALINRLVQRDAVMLEDFYGVNSIRSIRIVNNKSMAASVCFIEILDIDGVLYNRDYLSKESTVGLRTTKALAKKNPFKDTVIKEGAKIVVSMGYGNDPEELDIVFVGQIASYGGEGVIQLVCQSYGTELVQQRFGSDPSDEADWGNSTISNVVHSVLDREEVRHFGRWELSDIAPLNALLSAQEIRPDGQTKTIWTTTPSVIDDNIYVPTKHEDCLWTHTEDNNSCWDTLWGNVEYVFFDTTIWDVLQDMALRAPGTIAYPVPFGTGPLDARMTIFFGNPAQPYVYTRPSSQLSELLMSQISSQMLAFTKKAYEIANLSVARGQLASKGQRTSWTIVADKRIAAFADNLTTHEKDLYNQIRTATAAHGKVGANAAIAAIQRAAMGQKMRPFRNYEMATSAHNIISNSISASKDNTFNSIELIYSDDDVDHSEFKVMDDVLSMTINADDNIKPHHIRREVVYAPNVSTPDIARRHGSQVLANAIKETYVGSLMLTGMAHLKPHDILWINDLYSDMTGPIEVAEVVHSMSVEEGFQTEVLPHMVVSVNEDVTVTAVDAMTSLFTNHLAGYAKSAALGGAIVASGGLAGVALPGGTGNQSASANTLSVVGGVLVPAAIMWQPLIFGPSTVVAGYMFYKFVRYNMTREPIIITPLIKQGKPFVMGLEGFETDGLVISDIWSDDDDRADKAFHAIIGKKWKYWKRGISTTTDIIGIAMSNFWKIF